MTIDTWTFVNGTHLLRNLPKHEHLCVFKFMFLVSALRSFLSSNFYTDSHSISSDQTHFLINADFNLNRIPLHRLFGLRVRYTMARHVPPGHTS
jgi:hypothetical protein